MILNKLVHIVRHAQLPLSERAVADLVGVGRGTVARYRRLLAQYGLPPGKTRAEDCSARELNAHLNRTERTSKKAEPDFTHALARLREPGMTKRWLWLEYCENAGADHLGYVQFTRRFAAAHLSEDVAYYHEHAAGEVVFVDFSGDGPSYIDKQTGERVETQLFLAVLGCSRLMFAWCSPTQTVPDWLDVNTKMLEFFGGVPKMLVCDNLKSGVAKAAKVPIIQRDFLEWGRHYRIAVLPAKPKAPKQKAKVEIGVRNVQQWMLPALAKRKHFSLEQLNARIAELTTGFNDRPFQKMEGCRRSRFETEERSALAPLPTRRFEYMKWVCQVRVPRDYHIPVLHHYYSVPYTLRGQRVEGCVSAQWVEIHLDGECVARHRRAPTRGGHTTNPEHRHPRHQAQSQRTAENARAWAKEVGPSMERLMAHQFSGDVPLQGLPEAFALWDLSKRRAHAELEAAAAEALARHLRTAADVKAILAGEKEPIQEGRSAAALGRRPRRALRGTAQGKARAQPPASRFGRGAS